MPPPRSLMTMAAMLFLLAPPARAYRPFDGTDAQVAPPRALETELGPMGYVRNGDERLLVVPELTLNYGAGSSFEFVLEGRRLMLMNLAAETTTPLFDDIDLSMKKVLRKGVLQHVPGPSIATEEALLLPTTEEHGVGVSGGLVISQRWPNLALHLNGSISRTRAHELGRFASLIAEGPDRWTVRPVTELSLEREGDQTTSRGLLLGVLWQTRDGLTMDAGVLTGYGDERHVELRTGLTWKKHVPAGPKI